MFGGNVSICGYEHECVYICVFVRVYVFAFPPHPQKGPQTWPVGPPHAGQLKPGGLCSQGGLLRFTTQLCLQDGNQDLPLHPTIERT